jgi:hypothetical protein
VNVSHRSSQHGWYIASPTVGRYFLMQHQPTFWERFEHLAATDVNVLKNVLTHLPWDGAALLRGVSRGMRVAVNRTVTAVQCSPAQLLQDVELAAVFRDANRLFLRCQDSTTVAAFLERVLASLPVLLQKIQYLELSLVSLPHNLDDVASIARVLCRWAFTVGLNGTALNQGATVELSPAPSRM